MELSYYTVNSSGTLLDVAQAISMNKSRCAVVLEHQKVIGVISEGDLLRALLRGTDITSPMREFVHHGFIYLTEKNFEQALALFRAHGISLIPILDPSFVFKGVITLTDILTLVQLSSAKVNS